MTIYAAATLIGLFYGTLFGLPIGAWLVQWLSVRPLKSAHQSQMNGLRTALLAQIRRAEADAECAWETAFGHLVELKRVRLALETAEQRAAQRVPATIRKAVKRAAKGARR